MCEIWDIFSICSFDCFHILDDGGLRERLHFFLSVCVHTADESLRSCQFSYISEAQCQIRVMQAKDAEVQKVDTSGRHCRFILILDMGYIVE